MLLVCCRAPWYPPTQEADHGHDRRHRREPAEGLDGLSDPDGRPISRRRGRDLAEAAGRGRARGRRHRGRRPPSGATRWQQRARQDGRPKSWPPSRRRCRTAAAIQPLALIDAMRDDMPANTIYVEETITHSQPLQQHLPWTEPQSYFRVGGGLGQGHGLRARRQARGAQAAGGARRRRRLVPLQPDGAGAWARRKGNNLPVMIIVMNNRKYAAMQKGHLHHYPDGVAHGRRHVSRRPYRRARLCRARPSRSACTARRSRSSASCKGAIENAPQGHEGRQDRHPQCLPDAVVATSPSHRLRRVPLSAPWVRLGRGGARHYITIIMCRIN